MNEQEIVVDAPPPAYTASLEGSDHSLEELALAEELPFDIPRD